jgi:L-2,4-diaminobutyrate decarboxylase
MAEAQMTLEPVLRARLIEALFASVERWRGGEGPVLLALPPAEQREQLPALGAGQGTSALPALVDRILAQSQRVHHPRYLGHQIAAPVDLAAVMELFNGLLNNGMAIYEMGPIQTAAESRVVEWMASKLGMPAHSRGHFTSGGTLGNLTALLAARAWAYEGEVWREGQSGALPCVLVSKEAHYSIDRAVRVMGWGAGGIESVNTDAQHRMDPSDLEAAMQRARARGRRVIAVVGSACSTALGVFDPLEAIADFCEAQKLWMHVDGAHGASFVLTERGAALLRGVGRADSVVWDPHKMMRMPALMTGVLFSDRRKSQLAFSQDADYLFDPDADVIGDDPDVGHRTFECTKRGMALTLYACLHAYGETAFCAHLDSLLDTTAEIAACIEAAHDFELAQSPELNILCFRPSDPKVDGARLRAQVVQSGEFYVVETRLEGQHHLRLTIIEGGDGRARGEALLRALRSHI